MDLVIINIKVRYNLKYRVILFKKDKLIYLHLYKGYILPKRSPWKFSIQKVGLLTIAERISNLVYKLKLPPNWKMFNMVFVT